MSIYHVSYQMVKLIDIVKPCAKIINGFKGMGTGFDYSLHQNNI